MHNDPATKSTVQPGIDPTPPSAAQRRAAVVIAGHRSDVGLVRDHLSDSDPSVRAAALGALARCGALDTSDLERAIADGAPSVRRRACEEIGRIRSGDPSPTLEDGSGSRLGGGLSEQLSGGLNAGLSDGLTDRLSDAILALVDDSDALVAEAACWALGEWQVVSAVDHLSATARAHADVRCREAAVAALGAIGHPSGLDGVLAGLGDKPSVRRRAAVALASFEGPEVNEALAQCLKDRDWQVRQVAEILLED